MDAALSLEGVSKQYGDFRAVDDLSFSVGAGRIFGFLGPNGAGKTTSIRMALGLVEPTAGRIAVLGAHDARKVRDRIGFLPEERGLYRRMTPVEAVVFFAGLKGVPSAVARKRGVALLEAQGLGAAMHRPMKALSKGMAQKVQLITALAHEPDLVILDEPFSGLDPVNQQSLESLIRDLARRGATVIFSTHVMAHAERLCERVVLLAKGRKAFEGSVDEARAAAPRRIVLEGGATDAELRALPGVADITVHEAGVRTASLAPGAAAYETLRAAFAQGLDLTRFEVREPSLHDAFIVITGGV
jgi:ABC-2 type transport system ATP-binding protein